MPNILQRLTPDEVSLEIKDPVDPVALQQAQSILDELLEPTKDKSSVDATKLMEVGKRLGDLSSDASTYIISKEDCLQAYNNLKEEERQALTNIHDRVKAFATMQRTSIQDMEMDIPGGKAGHTVSPCNGTFLKYVCVWESECGLPL